MTMREKEKGNETIFVDGIDKATWCPIVFAVCTSEEKANAAKEALEKRGYGAKLRVVVSNLFLDQIRIGEEIINL